MTTNITREQLRELQDAGKRFDLIETLPEENFNEFHLPGAKNVPFDDDFDKRIADVAPDATRTIVVYCQNADCPASRKAASRLEDLGYTDVREYEAGKEDWRDAGLPVEAPASAGATR